MAAALAKIQGRKVNAHASSNSVGAATKEVESLSQSQDIPVGFCQCGCGAKTSPGARFIRGHHKRKPSPDNPQGVYRAEDRGFDSPCWICTSIHPDGYGRISSGGKARRAHRVMYEKLVGPIPDGLVIDHLCRVPECCNPEHLEPVTNEENTRRGNAGRWNAQKTHCRNGHLLSGDNLYVKPSTGARCCVICAREARRRWRATSKTRTTDAQPTL